MSARVDFDQRLADWMKDVASSPAPAGRFEQAIDATTEKRPRPRWLARSGGDWVGTTWPGRVDWAWPVTRHELLLAATVALLVLAAIVGALLVGGLQRSHPPAWRLGGLTYSVDGDIYVASADGGSPVLVADGTRDSAQHSTPTYWDPQWSFDGRYLMYQESSSIAQVVHVVDPQGNPVGSFPGWYSTWAPDSARIATWGAWAEDTVDVRTPDGSLVTTVAVPVHLQGCCGDQRAGWSPDGKNIALARSAMLFPVDGSAPRLPTVEEAKAHHIPPGPYLNPLWSPADDLIAVAGLNGPESIQIVNRTTGVATTIHTAPASGQLVVPVAWSPDGKAVLVIEGNGSPGGASIWSVPVDGSGGHVLVERADQEGADWRWVADGNY
jgi:WD40 repeat protein